MHVPVQPLKILHLLPSVDPREGGTVESVRQLLAADRKNHHSVICLDSPEAAWVKQCPLECIALGPAILNYRFCPKLFFWLRSNVALYDLVVVNGLWQFPTAAVWLALRNLPTPYFVFVHGMLDPWFKRAFPFKHLKKWLYWMAVEKRVLRRASRVIFTSEEELRLARLSFASSDWQSAIVSIGLAAPPGDPVRARASFLTMFPELSGKRIILSLGRIHPKKGIEVTVRAFASAIERQRDADAHLVIAGPGADSYVLEIRELVNRLGIGGAVTFAGMLQGDAKWGAFQCAEAFIISSFQENFGIAVAEALSCSLPVLVSTHVNIWREILADGAALAAEPLSAEFEKLINTWLCAEPPTWTKMRECARASYEARFAVGKMVSQLDEAARTALLVKRPA